MNIGIAYLVCFFSKNISNKFVIMLMLFVVSKIWLFALTNALNNAC